MKLNKIIGVTAALLIGVGTVATSHADGEKAKRDQRSGRSDQGADRHRDHRKQVVLSKDEVTKRYDKNGDGTLDYREKMVFIRSLGEDERAAYRKEFSQVGQGRSDRAGGEREHGDNKRQVSRRGMQGGPPAGMREMMQERMGGAKGGGRGSQGGPPAGMREMMQKRMGGARSGGRGQSGPKARGGSRGGSCEKCGAKKRGGDKRRGGRKDRRGNRGHR
ncbi:hypothetical protein N8546_00945 [bacterium]|nr:hypothetical protein [bacterium]